MARERRISSIGRQVLSVPSFPFEADQNAFGFNSPFAPNGPNCILIRNRNASDSTSYLLDPIYGPVLFSVLTVEKFPASASCEAFGLLSERNRKQMTTGQRLLQFPGTTAGSCAKHYSREADGPPFIARAHSNACDCLPGPTRDTVVDLNPRPSAICRLKDILRVPRNQTPLIVKKEDCTQGILSELLFVPGSTRVARSQNNSSSADDPCGVAVDGTDGVIHTRVEVTRWNLRSEEDISRILKTEFRKPVDMAVRGQLWGYGPFLSAVPGPEHDPN